MWQPGEIEWHVMLGVQGWPVRIVGFVQAVDVTGIRITRIDREAGLLDGCDIFVPWKSIGYLMVCGPDRDRELFEAASRWRL